MIFSDKYEKYFVKWKGFSGNIYSETYYALNAFHARTMCEESYPAGEVLSVEKA